MMNSNQKIALAVVISIAILTVGILASVVGNVGVRRVQVAGGITLNVQEPVVPGVPAQVRWSLDKDVRDRLVDIKVRFGSSDQMLTTIQLAKGSAMVVFPCSVTTTSGNISLVDKATGEVLIWQQVKILPAGPDCV